jgi:hypothetical protein
MRRLTALVFLFVAGCGSGTAAKLDMAAAREFVQSRYSNPAISLEFNLVEAPEYVTLPKIPRDHIAAGFPDRSAACGVRIRFTWREGNRTTHDDWVVWVNSDHKAVGWSSNAGGDTWREYVRTLAKK